MKHYITHPPQPGGHRPARRGLPRAEPGRGPRAPAGGDHAAALPRHGQHPRTLHHRHTSQDREGEEGEGEKGKGERVGKGKRKGEGDETNV